LPATNGQEKKMKDPKQSIQQIVDEYVETVNAARARWAHRKNGGQSGRTIGAAMKTLRTKVAKWGYSEAQIRQVLADARELAALEYAAIEE
jgi:hypothetical protein